MRGQILMRFVLTRRRTTSDFDDKINAGLILNLFTCDQCPIIQDYIGIHECLTIILVSSNKCHCGTIHNPWINAQNAIKLS